MHQRWDLETTLENVCYTVSVPPLGLLWQMSFEETRQRMVKSGHYIHLHHRIVLKIDLFMDTVQLLNRSALPKQ